MTIKRLDSVSHPPGTNESEGFLATPLQFLKGVGPRRAADFERVGLITIEDLLYRFPLRYEDRSRLQPIGTLKPGRPAPITGRILSGAVRFPGRRAFRISEPASHAATGRV